LKPTPTTMTRAEHHADSHENDVASDKKRLAATLNDHVGYENRIPGSELAERVGINESTMRDALAEVRTEYGIPVVSRGSGYYVIEQKDELQTELGRIAEEIATRKETKRELVDAWNERNGGDEA